MKRLNLFSPFVLSVHLSQTYSSSFISSDTYFLFFPFTQNFPIPEGIPYSRTIKKTDINKPIHFSHLVFFRSLSLFFHQYRQYIDQLFFLILRQAAFSWHFPFFLLPHIPVLNPPILTTILFFTPTQFIHMVPCTFLLLLHYCRISNQLLLNLYLAFSSPTTICNFTYTCTWPKFLCGLIPIHFYILLQNTCIFTSYFQFTQTYLFLPPQLLNLLLRQL